jgi:hypothetical protein
MYGKKPIKKQVARKFPKGFPDSLLFFGLLAKTEGAFVPNKRYLPAKTYSVYRR